jgi:hypothetical protein
VNTCLGSDTPRKRKEKVLRFNLKSEDRYEQAIHIWVHCNVLYSSYGATMGRVLLREGKKSGEVGRPGLSVAVNSNVLCSTLQY